MDVKTYNYDEFIDSKFEKLMRFGESLPLGAKVEDYPLVSVEGEEVGLLGICKSNLYTVGQTER